MSATSFLSPGGAPGGASPPELLMAAREGRETASPAGLRGVRFGEFVDKSGRLYAGFVVIGDMPVTPGLVRRANRLLAGLGWWG